MANYSSLISQVNNNIKTNGSGLITGQLLQTILDAMIASLGANYQYAGVATPTTNPGTPDQNVFWIAGTEGTYTNFNNIVVANEVAVLKWNGSWAKQNTGIKFVSVSQNTETGGYDLSVGGNAYNVRDEKQIETPETLIDVVEFPYFGYYRTNHTWVDSDGDKVSKYYKVQSGWKILVNISPDDGVIYTIIAFNANMEVLWDKCVSGNLSNYEYTVQSDVKYIRFGTRAGAAYQSAASVKFPVSITGIQADITNAIDGVFAILSNKLDFNTFGYYRWDNQQFVTSDGDKVTDFLPVQPEWDILVNISPDDFVINTITAFDENFNVLWGNCVHDNLVNYHYIVPAGVRYLRFGTRSESAYLEQAQVVFPISISSSVKASDLVVDLPVSDGTDIQSGYAYIDSTTYYIKVKQ